MPFWRVFVGSEKLREMPDLDSDMCFNLSNCDFAARKSVRVWCDSALILLKTLFGVCRLFRKEKAVFCTYKFLGTFRM